MWNRWDRCFQQKNNNASETGHDRTKIAIDHNIEEAAYAPSIGTAISTALDNLERRDKFISDIYRLFLPRDVHLHTCAALLR